MCFIDESRRLAVLTAALALLPLAVQAAGAARVDFAVGDVTLQKSSGERLSLAKGAELNSGETVRTGSGGRAQLRFDDGAMLSLQPQSEFRLDDYHYAGQASTKERSFFSLLKGGLRTITGLIGRGDRDAYRLQTSVATIGIRGTEYSISYLDSETLAVATGEGEIEVCNGAGCIVLRSGESAVVHGPDGPIQRTAVRPRLDPAQPSPILLATFSTSESRNADGALTAVKAEPVVPAPLPMTSGPGYVMPFAHGSVSNSEPSVNASFRDDGALLTAATASGSYQATVVAGAMSADGVIGWGRWSSGGLADSTLVNNFHYVVAQPASTSDLVALGNLTAVYSLAGGGYTLPTNQYGTVGGAPSGSLTASFSGGVISNVNLAMSVPINSNTYTLSTQSWVANGSRFDVNFAYNGLVLGGTANGVFTKGDARYVGASYNFNTYDNQNVSGAVVMKR